MMPINLTEHDVPKVLEDVRRGLTGDVRDGDASGWDREGKKIGWEEEGGVVRVGHIVGPCASDGHGGHGGRRGRRDGVDRGHCRGPVKRTMTLVLGATEARARTLSWGMNSPR